MSDLLLKRLSLALEQILARGAYPAETGVVLGSGLGDFADTLAPELTVEASSIPHYPSTGVPGHKGRILFARMGNRAIVAFQGRPHFYESGNVGNVLFPVLLAHQLGVRQIIFTNAAGGVNRTFRPGDLMVIADQINLTGESIPAGVFPKNARRGPIYDSGLVDLALATAARLGQSIQCGVYAGVKGPSYETAAEIEMVRRLGGDAVGMSTVLEATLASALGMRLLGISCITNPATGTAAKKLDHGDVTDVAMRVRERFSGLLSAILETFPPLRPPEEPSKYLP